MAHRVETKLLPIVVKPRAPFEQDALGREELCESLTRFVGHSTTPFTLAIDSQWGNGKTTFLHMWKAYLETRGFRCVFFDAFRCDFYCDALPALIGEIEMQIKPDITFKEKARELANSLISLRIIAAVSDEIPGGKIASELYQAASNSLKKHNAVQDYIDYQKAVYNFKNELEKAASSKGNKGKPLVVFIDELDRCRPTFAIDVLEKVKHIFDVPLVFFVFAINKSELVKIIESAYGDIDGDMYLDKFFDRINFLYSNSNLVSSSMDRAGMRSHLMKREAWQVNNKRKTEQHYREYDKFADTLFGMFNPSLRIQEKVMSTLRASLQTIPNDGLTFPILLSYFSVLKFVNPKYYESFRVAAKDGNWEGFPFENHLEFYRTNAGFSEVTTQESIPEDHLFIYRTLCILAYRRSKSYRDMVSEWSSLFWNSVKKLGYPGSYSGNSDPPDLSYIFDAIELNNEFRFDDNEQRSE